MRTWADDAALELPATTLDRDAGEGPTPRCCARRFVAADALVYFGELGAPLRAKIGARFPHLAAVPVEGLYLCDGCRETIRREGRLTRDEMPHRART